MTGSGTLADPYIIYDVNDLQNMNLDLTAYYELANDIDASATVGWNAGAGFIPIGQAFPYFTGYFDGKGYKVTSLFINRPAESNIGLFGYIETPSVVQNLGIEECNITGRNGGALARRNDAAITNCYSTGSITTTTSGGGLLAQNNGTMEECHSTCTVVSGDYAGGLVTLNNGTITKSYATGSVTATVWDAGGLVMRNGGTITNCYARGAVVANSDAGGLVEDNTGSIDKCYSTGLVTGGGTIGGLVERIFAPGTVTNSFWDTETSGTAISDGGTGKTTAQMKTRSTFTDAGWDFITPIWYIGAAFNNGYPAFEGVLIPTVTTDPVSNIELISASLNGTLDSDGGEACDCGFEWGETPAMVNTTPTQSRTTGQSFPQGISGLAPNKPYYFRAFATNSSGTGYGATRTFTSKASATVLTMPATLITEHTARLNGLVVDDGGVIGAVRFQWGLTTEYGNDTPWQQGYGKGDEFLVDLNKLAEGMGFHFRAQFKNSAGLVSGSDMVFNTLSSVGPVTLVEDEIIQLLEAV